MPLGKKPISCRPCAKRKVRCDRLQPCCHCKRRKQDTCVYPEFGGVSDQLIREQAVRIERLEEYVRVLGGNPNESNVRARLESTQVDKPHEQMSAVSSRPTKGGPALVRRTQRPTQTTSRLVENDGDLTYIET
jgi:Zn(2)-Cys(6) binuclear cluster domain-containing protein